MGSAKLYIFKDFCSKSYQRKFILMISIVCKNFVKVEPKLKHQKH